MKGCTKIQPDAVADKKLDRLAKLKGFGTRNTLLRHVANELSRVRPENFLGALGMIVVVGEKKRHHEVPTDPMFIVRRPPMKSHAGAGPDLAHNAIVKFVVKIRVKNGSKGPLVVPLHVIASDPELAAGFGRVIAKRYFPGRFLGIQGTPEVLQ